MNVTRAQADLHMRWSCPDCRGVLITNSRQAPQDDSSIPATNFVNYLTRCRNNFRVLARIPRGATIAAADALETLISGALEQQTTHAWNRLMSFSYWGLRRPENDETEATHRSLTSKVKKQISTYMESGELPSLPLNDRIHRVYTDKDDHLKKRVAAKFADGDIRGAVRTISSMDGVAPHNSNTLEKLRAKHPNAPDDIKLPESPDDNLVGPMIATPEQIKKAIISFRPGSAAGPDGLRPDHLKTLISKTTAEAGVRLIKCLTDMTNLILAGGVPEEVTSIFFGATLCALTKKDGGLRPVAVGNTIRRLAIKVAIKPLSAALGQELRPTQLGFATSGGCEAAAHSARKYIAEATHRRVFLKIDMKNAFNCLRRDSFLEVARRRVPEMYRVLWQAYSKPSTLFYNDTNLQSSTGIQQGDPAGPALFSLAIDEIARRATSEFNVWYLDDASLGDTPEKVLEDLNNLIRNLREIGLEINSSKCELTILNHESSLDIETTLEMFRGVLPDVRLVTKEECSLLGAPIHVDGINAALATKKVELEVMAERLVQLDNHQAFILLKNCFAIPKLQYLLRASPAYLDTVGLFNFDETVRKALTNITNVLFMNESWVQATFPVKLGGLGIRKSSDIALPSFISSMHSVSNLVDAVLSRVSGLVETGELTKAEETWSSTDASLLKPVGEDLTKQKLWDLPLMELKQKSILANSNQTGRARLLAAARSETGAWLHAIPVPSLGTQLDEETLRISLALRVGANVCESHKCRCGANMDKQGLHGLSCKYSAGRHSRHSALNDVIKRALQKSGLDCVLEPVGTDRGDGKRPDGVTIFPFEKGKSLCWDCTCVDTFAETCLMDSATRAGYAADEAERRKKQKYTNLAVRYQFEPIAIETAGTYGKTSVVIINKLGRRLQGISGDPRETLWLKQRLGLAIQRGNAFCILKSERQPPTRGWF